MLSSGAAHFDSHATLTVMLAANSRLLAQREPLAHESQGNMNSVCVYVSVCLPAHTMAAGAWYALSYSLMCGAKKLQ